MIKIIREIMIWRIRWRLWNALFYWVLSTYGYSMKNEKRSSMCTYEICKRWQDVLIADACLLRLGLIDALPDGE